MTAAVLIATPDPVDCPNCDGQGTTSERLFGRHVIDEYVDRECAACSGTGQVDAECVRTCEDCQTRYWLEVGGCGHRDLCPECGPSCKDCTREAREDVEFDRYRELERIRIAVTR